MITSVNGQHPRHRRPRTLAVVVALWLALSPVGTAASQEADGTAISNACVEAARATEPFDDVPSGTTHAQAISCLWAYGITTGRSGEGTIDYDPQGTVTREQMASFVARTLGIVTNEVYALPEAHDGAQYADNPDISDGHLPAVNQLTDAGIIQGYADGTFRPAEELDRAQMATFLVAAIEAVAGTELGREARFDDISGTTHEANIEKLVAAGITIGTSQSSYSPTAPISRGQMASFIARTLGHLIQEGLLQPLEFDPGTGAMLGLTDVELAAQDETDRVTFTLEGDDEEAGWRVQYVDEARSAGSGNPVDVEGEAVLQVILTGMAIPPDLPADIEAALWDEGSASLDGEGIVEIVDDGVFEGQQQLFIGTTGLNPFSVQRAEDPQRISIDIAHTA